jgi:hypothetical protein
MRNRMKSSSESSATRTFLVEILEGEVMDQSSCRN